MTINKATGDADPDVTGIRNAIVDLVNSTDFIGRLDGSRIIDVAHNFLSDNLSITSLDLFGRIRRPDGSLVRIRDADSIVVPSQPEHMLTPNTLQFFCEFGDVVVSVQSVIPVAR